MSTNYYAYLESEQDKVRKRFLDILELSDHRMAVYEIKRQLDTLLGSHREAVLRATKLHIGKYSGGWVFTFRGHSEPNAFYGVPAIRSFQDWKKFLTETPGLVIRDEYDTLISEEEFFETVLESKTPWGPNRTPRMNYARWLQSDEGRRHGSNDGRLRWTDDEGYDFGDYEFS